MWQKWYDSLSWRAKIRYWVGIYESRLSDRLVDINFKPIQKIIDSNLFWKIEEFLLIDVSCKLFDHAHSAKIACSKYDSCVYCGENLYVSK